MSLAATVLEPARVPYTLVPEIVAPFTIPEAVRVVTAAVLAPARVPYTLVPEIVAPFTIPEAVTLSAVTSSRLASAPNRAPETPTPPATIKAPAVLPSEGVVPYTLETPPICKFSWVLIPPTTFRAPVVAESEVVLSRMTTLFETTSSTKTFLP